MMMILFSIYLPFPLICVATHLSPLNLFGLVMVTHGSFYVTAVEECYHMYY
jgi:hypothetical protein